MFVRFRSLSVMSTIEFSLVGPSSSGFLLKMKITAVFC